jgi:hypothetical protein
LRFQPRLGCPTDQGFDGYEANDQSSCSEDEFNRNLRHS